MPERVRTQEERIEAAARAHYEISGQRWDSVSEGLQALFLDRMKAAFDVAATPVVETPAWPTDESGQAYMAAAAMVCTAPGSLIFEQRRKWLQAAFEVDPIHQAAVEMAQIWSRDGRMLEPEQRLYDAVVDAGLLDTETGS